MKFEFMKKWSIEFPIEKMAKVLNVSKSGYYSFLKSPMSSRKVKNLRLVEKIKQISRMKINIISFDALCSKRLRSFF